MNWLVSMLIGSIVQWSSSRYPVCRHGSSILMDSFVIKKLVSTFLHLLPGSLLLILLTILLLRRRRPRLAWGIVTMLSTFLVLLHSPPVANALVAPLENDVAFLQKLPEDAGAILVLGHGHIWAAERSVNSRLMAVALSRITEASRLWKTRPDSLLITSGAPLRSPISHAQAMADMAVELGVQADQIVMLEDTRDTIDEINGALRVLRDTLAVDDEHRRLVVVSSATHLPRTRMILEASGVEFALAPTDYLELDAPWYRLDGYFIYSADRAIHEYIGMLWLKLRYVFIDESQ